MIISPDLVICIIVISAKVVQLSLMFLYVTLPLHQPRSIVTVILYASFEFIMLWKEFLSQAKVKATPTLYQQLSTLIFNEEVSKAMKVERSSLDAIKPLSH